MEIVEEAENSL
jgi:hypothetical protein